MHYFRWDALKMLLKLAVSSGKKISGAGFSIPEFSDIFYSHRDLCKVGEEGIKRTTI